MQDPIVEIRTDSALTTASDVAAGPDVAKALHSWPTDIPADDEIDPIRVAVMDSGIHQDLVENHPWFENVTVVDRFDYTGSENGGDAVGHGSGCASIIGVAAASVLADFLPNDIPVELESHRIFGSGSRTGIRAIAEAYANLTMRGDKIDIVNMSWGARDNDPRLNRLHDKLLNAGAHDVVAAGNTGSDGGSPATNERAFSAGAVNKHGDLTRFTSSDPPRDNPDVAALGKDVKLARAPGTSMGRVLNDDFVKASGTSFAAPYTVAAYTIALAVRRTSWDTAFEQAAPDIPGTKKDGSGLLKAASAIHGETPGDQPPTTNGFAWNFNGDTLWLDAEWLPEGDTQVTKLDETKDHVDIRVDK